MKKLQGISASAGSAVGILYYMDFERPSVHKTGIRDAEAEVECFRTAQSQAVAELERLSAQAVQKAGAQEAEIFELHVMLAQDMDFTDRVEQIIRTEMVDALFAVEQAGEEFATQFAALDDDYMRQRAADVRDVTGCMLDILQGKRSGMETPLSPCVLAADDLLPSKTIELDKSNVLAIVTRNGSALSHSAILARTMDIPAVVGVGGALDSGDSGRQVIVDGDEGVLYIDPDENILKRYGALREIRQAEKEALQALADLESRTADGRLIEIAANIGCVEDARLALQRGADGIGLFRSEFLFLESESFPAEQQQYLAYRAVLEQMGDRRVVIRTLDIGADKQTAYFNLDREDNPALGIRGIRVSLARPELLKTQLTALLRASVYGRLAVMFPMVTSVAELEQALTMVETCKGALEARGQSYAADIEWGVMIETPAAAVVSDRLAVLADFFSIGTNDLTQYTTAADRMNPKVAGLCDPGHPAVLRLVRLVAENALRLGKWVGVCGESAADPELLPLYLAMGVTELSVAPASVLRTRQKVRSLCLTEEQRRLEERLK